MKMKLKFAALASALLCTLTFSIAMAQNPSPPPAEVTDTLPWMASPDRHLEQTKAALEFKISEYRQIAASGGWPDFPVGSKVTPGFSDARMPALRKQLTLTGDLVAAEAAPGKPDHYSADLQKAMKRFQARHGLEADGVIGGQTQVALHTPLKMRIAQMQASYEQMGLFEPVGEEKYILVNIPSYTLMAFQDGQLTVFSKVIVGNKENATPLFSNQIETVIFNPTWGVPKRIAGKEMLAKIRKDPRYLESNGFDVYSGSEKIDPHSINWQQVSATEFPYLLRQQAGDGNALGKIKFMIPENQNIYLHSTSAPQLFKKTDRALSHGCVRVEKSQELAHFVLEGNGLDATQVDDYYKSDKNRGAHPILPTAVRMVYWPAWVDENGLLQLRPDVYGLQEKRVAELMAI